MSRAQRSKTGCWTCRLRRKKCNEGGLPCVNCESRGILCHGYGPKPPWKDRGEKEREQASMLRLQPRQRRRGSKNLSSGISPPCSARNASTDDSDYNLEVTALGIHSPSQSDLSLSSLSSSQDRQAFDFLDSLVTFGSLDAPESSHNDVWLSSSSAEAPVGFDDFQPTTGSQRSGHLDDAIRFSSDSWPGPNPAEVPISTLAEFQPPMDGRRLDPLDSDNNPRTSLNSAETLDTLADFQHPARDPQSRPAIGLPIAAAAQVFDVDEREVELVMHFIGETFAIQHTSYRAASTMQRSWLLLLLMRSPTFYYASLSMSAYHYYLSLSGDSEVRVSTFQAYQKYRTCALTSFNRLLESGQPSTPSSGSVPGECIICGVQIALLEVRNLTYFSSTVSVDRLVTTARPLVRTCRKVDRI